MKFLKYIDSLITKTNYIFFRIGAFFTFCLVVLMFSSVLTRYIFQSSFVWFDELLWHIFGLSFLLASAYTLNQEGHVRVDIFYQRYSKKTKAIIDIAGVLFFLLPLCSLLCYFGYYFALNAYTINEISGSPNGLPYRWIIKSSIPFGFLLLIFQGFSYLIKQIFILADSSDTSQDTKPK